MKRQNLRTVSLIVVTFTYLLVGAAIFGYLESEHEVRQRETLELIELILRRKYNISEDDFNVLTTTVIKSVPHKAGIQWKFSGAFYFATTVVTTVGYGHSTPATVAGRSFCMVYALVGIPLGLVMFQSIGERLNTFVASILRHGKRCFKAANPEVTQTNLVMVVSVLSTILMTSMAAVFAKYERWDYFDALYYCFITLTTIGFGDYVALQKESALQSKPEYVALSLIFILFGLSVVSSAVNLLVLKFLTLNTEDERRDEQLRFTANLNPIQLEGDIITSAPGQVTTLARLPRPNGSRPPALGASLCRPDDLCPAQLARCDSIERERWTINRKDQEAGEEDDDENDAEDDEDDDDDDDECDEEEGGADADDELELRRASARTVADCPDCSHARWLLGRARRRRHQQVPTSGASAPIYVISRSACCASDLDGVSSGTCSCASSVAPSWSGNNASGLDAGSVPSLGRRATAPRAVARLVCKCCCQHSECVQHAIQTADRRRRTSGLTRSAKPQPSGRLDPDASQLARVQGKSD